MQKDEILKSMSASESKGDEIFEEGEGQSKGGKKVSLDYAPPTITLDIDGVSVLFKTPSTWRESDLCVLLDTAQLTAVCDFLLKDSSLNISSEKRPYQKSGSYSKSLRFDFISICVRLPCCKKLESIYFFHVQKVLRTNTKDMWIHSTPYVDFNNDFSCKAARFSGASIGFPTCLGGSFVHWCVLALFDL